MVISALTHAHPVIKFTGFAGMGLKWFRSSEQAQRGFCGVCGASLFYQRDEGELLHISAGMLESPTGLQTCAHIYCEARSAYYKIADELPRFNQDSGDEFREVLE